MPITTTASPSSSADRLQRFFSRTLLEKITPVLVLEQFAWKEGLPKRAGAKTMRFTRFTAPSTADIQSLTEGTPMATSAHKQLSSEYVDVDLSQFGQVISISDIADSVDLFNLLEQATVQQAQDAALHCDTIVRNELKVHTGTVGNVDYSTKNFIFGGTGTSYASVYNTGTYSANFIITGTDVLDGVTSLKIQNAPRIGGYYILAAAPQVTRDLMNVGATSGNAFTTANQYGGNEQIYKGEVGRLFGAKVIETTNPWRAHATQGTFSATGAVFSSFMFGMGAFGVPSLAGQSPFGPRVTIVRGADKSDPLEQIAAQVGFKTFYAAKLLQPKWLTEVYSQSAYGQ
jgi:N4-gp56 family major capsid protein